MIAISKFERAVLRVLLTEQQGLYGSNFPALMPEFWFVRSRVYSALAALVDRGLVLERYDPPRIPGSNLRRCRHYITAKGEGYVR